MLKLQHLITKKLVTILLIFLALPISVFLVQQTRGVQGSTSSLSHTIYEDALASGWHARSRASHINLANPSPVYSGSKSISFTPTGRGARLYLYTNTAIDTALYSSLRFAAQASRAGQDYSVTLYDGANKPLSTVRLAHYGGDPVHGSWKEYNIPLSDLRANATHIRGVAIQSRSYRYATLYLDSVRLRGSVSSPTPTPTPTSTPSPTSTPIPTPTPSAPPGPAASINTVFIIVMENNNWSSIRGNSSAPYINNVLLPQSSYATQYFNPPGNHPSEPNYLWLEAGSNLGVSNDNPPSDNHQNTTAHLVTQLKNAGLSWKAYQEGIDGKTCPLVDNHPYAPKHNAMVFFNDVTGTNNPNSAYCIAHERPYTELATDLQDNTVANYNFITPNLCDDMHDSCSPTNNGIKQGDTWLSHEVPTILNSQAYKNGGALFITWDEGEHGSDGPIGMIVLSPNAKGNGYNNSIHYTHSSTLKTIQEIFHVTPLLGDAANATDLADLFQPGVLNPPSSSGQGQGSKLSWAPPRCGDATHACATYQISEKGQGHQYLGLDASKDWIVKLPGNGPQKGGIDIDGGHNVIIIGGEIDLTTPCTSDGSNCHGINISRGENATGEVYIEGVLIKNPDAEHARYTGDGIDVNTAATTKVTLENIRIEGIDGCGANGLSAHADVFQPYGARNTDIQVDHLTGTTDLQGMQIDPDTATPHSGTYKNVNITILRNPHSGCTGSTQYGWWLTRGKSTCETYPITLSNAYEQEPSGSLASNAVWPDTHTSLACPPHYSNGVASWPGLANVHGSIINGLPPGGDFVPVGVAGIHYVSPGYQTVPTHG